MHASGIANFCFSLWLVWRSVQGELEQLQKFPVKWMEEEWQHTPLWALQPLQRLTLANQSQNLYSG